jgi:hypothetical protein
MRRLLVILGLLIGALVMLPAVASASSAVEYALLLAAGGR